MSSRATSPRTRASPLSGAASPRDIAAELRRLRSLHEAALAIAAPVSPEPSERVALLGRLIEYAVSALGGRDGLLLLEDDPAWNDLAPGTAAEEGCLTLRAGGQIERRPTRAEGATAFVLRTGTPAAVPDTLDPKPFGTYQDLAERGIRALALVPLNAGTRTLGALSLGFDRPGPLSEIDAEALELFGAHAVAALERVRLMHAERERAEEFSRRDAEAHALRDLDRLKDQFIAMISHELRTPLSLVFGYAELLQNNVRGFDPTTTELMAGKIRVGAEQLARLVDDLLDFARIERGEVVVRPEVFDLAPALRELCLTLRAQPGGEHISCDVPAELWVRADRARVSQVISHLVGNAIKYAPAGQVARVEVEDEGPGIPLDEQPRVWDRFYRGTTVSEKNVSRGAGLGLSIVKTMVEAQRGRVGLESEPGRGARFWFELPVERAPS